MENIDENMSWAEAFRLLALRINESDDDELKRAFDVFLAGRWPSLSAFPPSDPAVPSAEWRENLHQIFETLEGSEVGAYQLVRVVWRFAVAGESLVGILQDLLDVRVSESDEVTR